MYWCYSVKHVPSSSQTGCGGLEDQRDTGSSGVLKRASPTHCLTTNGQLPDGLMHLDIRTPGKWVEQALGFQATQGRNIPPEESQPLLSSQIPVPRHRYREVYDPLPQTATRRFSLCEPLSPLGLNYMDEISYWDYLSRYCDYNLFYDLRSSLKCSIYMQFKTLVVIYFGNVYLLYKRITPSPFGFPCDDQSLCYGPIVSLGVSQPPLPDSSQSSFRSFYYV